MKFLANSLLVGLFIVLIGAFLPQSTMGNVMGNKTYHKPIPSLAINFDPQTMEDSYSYHIISQVYDTLFELDEFLSIKPRLAADWRVSDDGLEYLIKLKPNIRFHDGKLLTADDVIYTLHRFIKKSPYKYPELLSISGVNDYLAQKTKTVKGIEKLSDLSVKIALVSPSPTFIMVLTTPHLSVLPSDLDKKIETIFFQRTNGTGAFKIKSYVKNKRLELVQNNDYFEGAPQISELFYEQATRQQAIDGFNNRYFHDLQWYNPSVSEIKVDYSVVKFPVSRVDLLIFNTRRLPFSDKRTRAEVVAAMDTQKLFNICYSDKIAAKGLIPFGIGGYDKNFNEYAAAVTTVSKRELSNQKVIFLRMENYPCQRDFDGAVKDFLKTVKFDTQVNYVTFQDFIDNYWTNNNYDIVELQFFSDYPEAAPLLNYFYSRHPANISGFSSKKYDELLSQAGSMLDKYSRYNIYHQLQKILKDEAIIIPIYYDIETIIYQQKIRGMKQPALISASLPMKYISFEE